jgi:predicted transcriptional regulator
MSKKEMNKVYDEIDKKKKKETERKSIKQKRLEKLIDMDPQLRAIDKRIKAINKKYDKDRDPEFVALMKKYGL